MSARSTPVAAVQTRAHDRADFAERWPVLLARIADAAESGARVVVVPEGTVPAYVIGTERVDPQQIEAAARDVIAVASRTGATIVYGSARAGEQGLANTAYVVTPDGIAGFADKCFLWHFDRRWFRAGDALEPVDTPAGRLGVFVCADGRMPTIGAHLVERGAEALVMPTAWVTSGRDPRALENLQADLMVPVRARENGVPMIVANKCGIEARSVAYCGKSQIVAADGTIVAIAAQDDETTLRAAVDFAPATPARRLAREAIRRGGGDPLPPAVRIAIALDADAALRASAALADADVVLDAHGAPPCADVAYVDGAAMLDPRALVPSRLDGVRLFGWRVRRDADAPLDPRWVTAFARTRAAELRAYVVAFDEPSRRAFAVDPDGAVVCGTFDGFQLAAFAFDRARTDAWRVAPATDVREGLVRVEAIVSATRERGAAVP